MVQKNVKYVIITPVRDEEKYIESTMRAVVRQSIQPAEWIVVNDGSTDKTGSIIEHYASRNPWIRPRHRADRGFRESGGGVVEAFYEGYSTFSSQDWEFIVKLDGDLSFAEDYFEKALEHFCQEPRLGIGGGTLYHIVGGKRKAEECPRFHVRGATKIYRRECWNAIGGLWPAPGWDTIDEVKANMLGWRTYTFPDLSLIHLRPTGTADGMWHDMVKKGRAHYISGYHPLFMAARCLYRLASKPYVVGSIGMLYGFVTGYLKNIPQVSDKALIEYLRSQQLRRLCARETIWR